jgi:hypothetical protein
MKRRRKIIVSIATSADGYIARPDGVPQKAYATSLCCLKILSSCLKKPLQRPQQQRYSACGHGR